jgi:hypothetical protein
MTLPLSADQISDFARKNAIINGDMRIAQRGTSFVSPSGGTYLLDRWRYAYGTSTATHTVTQDTDTPGGGFQYSMKFVCTGADASVDAGGVITPLQYIEGYNFAKFVGQTATLSFWIKAGRTGTMCIGFRNDGGDRAYVSEVTIDAANTWEKKTITLAFDYSGGTWDLTTGRGLAITFGLHVGSTYQTATTDTWLTGDFRATSNQTNFVDAADSTNDIWITGVQLELGSGASDFEFLDYQQQLAMCQRYYQIVKAGSAGFAIGEDWYSVSSSEAHWWTVPLSPDMRGAPSVSIPSLGAVQTLNVTSWSVQASSVNTFTIRAVATAAGRAYCLHNTSDDEFVADAEL